MGKVKRAGGYPSIPNELVRMYFGFQIFKILIQDYIQAVFNILAITPLILCIVTVAGSGSILQTQVNFLLFMQAYPQTYW